MAKWRLMDKKKISENVSDYNQVFTKADPPAASPLGIFLNKYTFLPGKSIFKLRGIEWFLEKRGSRKILARSQNFRNVFDGSQVSFAGDLASWSIDPSLES